MKKFILLTGGALITFCFANNVQAGCYAKEHYNAGINCLDSWNPGEANNCGDGCTYTYNNGKLTVTATKPDAVIPRYMFSPLYYEDGIFPNVKDIEISGKFDIIDADAFYANLATISGKDGILYVKDVINVAFAGNTLVGTIIVDEKKQRLGTEPWYSATLNATVILPPTIKSISGWALFGLTLGKNAKIYCGVENCEELFKNVDCEGFSTNENNRTQCKNRLKTLLSSGKLLPYPDGCTKMGASGCTKCKNENFKLNDGECDRLRWTPAEAAEVLKDDNTNSVTITFKK